MYNKILPTVLIMILVGSLSSVATSCMLCYVLPQAIAHADKMLTYDNSTYGIRMQYPSNWHKEENLSSGSDNNSMLVDVVKFISPTKNASDSSSESLDIKIDYISDIQPITLAKYANNSIEDLRKDFDIIKLDRNASLSNNPAY
ncbi:MAG: hypothetical protein WAJ93_13260, partial [Candidatus Nitrosopolaris sp.]